MAVANGGMPTFDQAKNTPASALLAPLSLGLWACVALVGLWDDFVDRLSASRRLMAVMIFSLLWVVATPDAVRPEVYLWLPELLRHEITIILAAAFIITAFVNAGNMADGANGLLSIISLAFFICMYFDFGGHTGVFALIMALSIFVVFNVATGKIFLGDFGSYGLSAALAMTALVVYGTGQYTMWLLASILSYPCVELVRVFADRAIHRVSPMRAGNDHSHNYLYRMLRERGLGQVFANSMTGCAIAIGSAVIPVVLCRLKIIEADQTFAWLAYFLGYVLVHLVAAWQLKQWVTRKDVGSGTIARPANR